MTKIGPYLPTCKIVYVVMMKTKVYCKDTANHSRMTLPGPKCKYRQFCIGEILGYTGQAFKDSADMGTTSIVLLQLYSVSTSGM